MQNKMGVIAGLVSMIAATERGIAMKEKTMWWYGFDSKTNKAIILIREESELRKLVVTVPDINNHTIIKVDSDEELNELIEEYNCIQTTLPMENKVVPLATRLHEEYNEYEKYGPAIDLLTCPIKKPIPPMPNGMHEWIVEGKTVYAATKKAAIKKANKQV